MPPILKNLYSALSFVVSCQLPNLARNPTLRLLVLLNCFKAAPTYSIQTCAPQFLYYAIYGWLAGLAAHLVI